VFGKTKTMESIQSKTEMTTRINSMTVVHKPNIFAMKAQQLVFCIV